MVYFDPLKDSHEEIISQDLAWSKIDHAAKVCSKKWKMTPHIEQIHHPYIPFIKENFHFSINSNIKEKCTCVVLEESEKGKTLGGLSPY